MMILRKITRHCEIFARKSKQFAEFANAVKQPSTNKTRESSVNPLILRESKCDNLLIRFSIIDFLYLLTTRVLDCHDLTSSSLAMTSKGSESAICLAMMRKTHLLRHPSAREGEFFASQISLKGAKMVT